MAKSSTRRVTIYINGKEVEASVKQIRAEMNRLINEQNRMVIGSDEYIAHAKKIRELREYLKEHARNIGSAASAWSEMYNKFLQFGAGIGGFVQIFNTFDSITSTLKQVATDLAAMDDVYSDVMKTTNLTREEVDELNESFKKLDTRTSREQLNNLAYIAGKLGISSQELVQQFVEAADIINVSMGDVLGDDATLAVGKMVDVYKKSTDILKDKSLKEQLLSLGSAVNELGKVSTANEQYMVNFTGRLGGIAVQAGLTADQILGYASALDQDMQKVEMSATAFQKLIQKVISKPAEFARIAGMEVKDFTNLIETDMNQALKKVLAGFSGAGGFDKLLPVFQDLGLDGARAAAAISSMANSLDKVETAQSVANRAMTEGISCYEEFSIKNNNMQANLEKARKKFQDTRLELGQQLYPILLKLTKAGTFGIKALAQLVKYCQQHTIAVRAIIAPMVLYLARLTAANAAQLFSNLQKQRAIILENTLRGITLQLAAAKAQLAGNTTRAAAAMKLLNQTTNKIPLVAIATAITTIAVALTGWIRKNYEFKKSTDHYAQHLKILEETSKEYERQSRTVTDLVNIVRNENISNEERLKAIRKLKDIMPDYNAELTEEGRLINENTGAISNYLKILNLQIEAKITKQKLEEAQNRLSEWDGKHKGKLDKEAKAEKERIRKMAESYEAEWYKVGKKLQGYWASLVSHNNYSNQESWVAVLQKQRGALVGEVEALEADYNEKLQEIAEAGGSPTDVVTEETEPTCTGDYRTCSCPDCTEKRNRANAAVQASEAEKKAWERFSQEMARLREEDRQGKMDDLEKEKAQIAAKFQEQIDTAKSFEKTRGRQAVAAEEELARLRDSAIERADAAYRKKQMAKIEESSAKLNEKAAEIQARLGTSLSDKYAKELQSVQQSWKATMKEIDENIKFYQSKEGETYDPIKGTGLSEEEVKLLNGLLEKKKQAVALEVQEELEIVGRAEAEISDTLLSETEKRISDVKKEYQEKIAIAQTAIAKLKALGEEENKDRIKQLEEQIDALKSKMDKEVADIEKQGRHKTATGIGRLLQIDWKNFKKDWEKNLSEIADVIQEFANTATQIFDSINQIQKNRETAMLNQYKKNYDERKKKLDWQLEQGIISQEYYDAQTQKMDEERDAKEKELELEQFHREKKAALAEAIISGIVAAVKSFENGGGFPWGLISMALSLAATGVQVAAIASQPEPFAKGGYIDNEKHILAGEEGREWIASNKLLSNPETAPVIEALQLYQQGDKSAFRSLDLAVPDSRTLSQAAETISRNIAPGFAEKQVTTENNASRRENGTLEKMLEEISALRSYMSDPRNRQAVISRELQTEFEQQEDFLRNAASLK